MKYFRTYTELEGDILKLYCKTGRKDIERLFLRLASEIGDAISSSLSSNKGIRKQLQDPLVLDALLFLSELRKKYPNTVTINDIGKTFVGSSDVRYIPYLRAFNNYLSDTAVNDLLSPFSDVILVVAGLKMSGGEVSEGDNIKNDLLIIRNSLSHPAVSQVGTATKLNVKQKKYDMFIFLLDRFSGELSQAAKEIGFDELSQKFSENIIAKPIPMGLGKYLKLSSITDDQIRLANKMAQFVMKNYEHQYKDYNHDIIDITFLKSAGIISQEDVMAIKEAFEKEKDVMSLAKGGDYGGLGHLVKTGYGGRLNSSYLYMLSTFFVFLQKELSLPNVIFDLP